MKKHIKNFRVFVNESILSSKLFTEIPDNIANDSGVDDVLRVAENEDGSLLLVQVNEDEYLIVFEPFDGTLEVEEMGPYSTLEEADRIFNRYVDTAGVIDKLLEKIKRTGLNSLTQDEKELLDKNSRSF